MRSRTVLVAILVLLPAAAATILWFARHEHGLEVASGVRRGGEVAPLDPARAVSLRVEIGGKAAAATRAPEGWRGASGPAASAQADAVLARLAALRRRSTVARAESIREELPAYGLARPRAHVEVTLDDGRTLTWALGDGTGKDGVAFVLAPDGTVVIAAQQDEAALERALAAFAGAEPLPASRMDVPDLRAPEPAAGFRR